MTQLPIKTFDTPDWATLAQSIGDGEAILLLGPDAVPMYRVDNQPEADALPQALTFSQLTRLKIKHNPKVKYAFHYQRDNLYLFQDNESKKEAKKTVREAARDKAWLPDKELLRQIAAIPFSVVLSINPDTFVRDAFVDLGIPRQFDYYSSKDKTNEENITTPAPHKPLIYNLCGCTEDIQSVILDYNDLFALLKNMLNDLKVPEALRTALRQTDTYILLGFHFDRWYFQLLLHYLNMLDGEFDNSNKTFSILSELNDGDETQEFVMQQFNLKWIAPNREDFEQLFAACEQKKILRKIDQPQSSRLAEVRQRIARNDVAGAIDVLENAETDTDRLNTLTILRGRLAAWQEETVHKIKRESDLDIAINQIRYTLLSLAAQTN